MMFKEVEITHSILPDGVRAHAMILGKTICSLPHDTRELAYDGLLMIVRGMDNTQGLRIYPGADGKKNNRFSFLVQTPEQEDAASSEKREEEPRHDDIAIDEALRLAKLTFQESGGTTRWETLPTGDQVNAILAVVGMVRGLRAGGYTVEKYDE
jgi:hypothetical protein